MILNLIIPKILNIINYLLFNLLIELRRTQLTRAYRQLSPIILLDRPRNKPLTIITSRIFNVHVLNGIGVEALAFNRIITAHIRPDS